MSLSRSSHDPVIDEFLINVMDMSLQEVFPTEFANFLGLCPSNGPARQKMEKKNKGKVKVCARV